MITPQIPEMTSAFVAHLQGLDGVVAIGMGGSRASGQSGSNSDIDLYVLTANPIDPQIRRRLIKSVADDPNSIEIANSYWGDEDGFVLDGIWHDVVYFDAEWFFGEIDGSVNQHRAKEGYSTSFVFTLANMVPIHDPDGLLATWKLRTRTYPDALAEAIIHRNVQVSCVIHACYRNQIARAVELNDSVALNHRVAALLACVFDIAFATVRAWHPGEKRQLNYLDIWRESLPNGFGDHIEALLAAISPASTRNVMTAVDQIVADLHSILDIDLLSDRKK